MVCQMGNYRFFESVKWAIHTVPFFSLLLFFYNSNAPREKDMKPGPGAQPFSKGRPTTSRFGLSVGKRVTMWMFGGFLMR
jgi:hypothetical protein